MQTGIDWKCIESFIGYGNIDAPVVFIGIEEGLSAPLDELECELRLRSRFAPVMDMAVAHKEMKDTERFFREAGTASQRTWRPMCDLMLRWERKSRASPTLNERKAYQRNRLGRIDGQTLLTELLPYPNVKTSGWAYDGLGQCLNRGEYEANMLEPRLQLLAGALSRAKRRLIMCYGKARWPQFRRLIARAFDSAQVPWRPAGNSLFQVADVKGTRIVLSGHFSARLFNTQAQLDDLARAALAGEGPPQRT